MERNIASACLELFGFHIKSWQEQAVGSILKGEDTVVIAGTGYGKSLTFFLPIAMQPERVAIVISPLKALQHEQQEKLTQMSVPAAVVNESTLCSSLLKDIAEGVYRAVFISPEMLFSPHRQLMRLWQGQKLRQRISFVAVDEAHCVVDWGASFRKDYARLGEFRCWIPGAIPFLALSATMPPKMHEELSKLLHLKSPTPVIVGNERVNVTLCVRPLRHAASSFNDLNFLMTAHQTPKTIVYVNKRLDAEFVANHLRKLKTDVPVYAYHALKSEEKKKEVLEKFRTEHCSILCCTEAAGMGMDVPDVELVVQFLLPNSINALIQRIGRCARSSNITGKGLLLVQPVFLEQNFGKSNDIEPALREYVNLQTCRVSFLNKYYQNPSSILERTAVCCDICDPNVAKEFASPMPQANPKPKPITPTRRRTKFQKEEAKVIMGKWRDEVFNRDWESHKGLFGPDFVLPDKIWDTLSRKLGSVYTVDDVKSICGGYWAMFERYGEQLSDLICKINVKFDEAALSSSRKPRRNSNMQSEISTVSTPKSAPSFNCSTENISPFTTFREQTSLLPQTPLRAHFMLPGETSATVIPPRSAIFFDRDKENVPPFTTFREQTPSLPQTPLRAHFMLPGETSATVIPPRSL